jgi:hypothetical protein
LIIKKEESMQKVFCDVCKKEIKQAGSTFAGQSGKVVFSVEAKVSDDSKDLCLACTVKAVNSVANNKLKRPYTKKPATVVAPPSTPATN